MFTPKTPVDELYAHYINKEPINFNFSEGYGEVWESVEASYCEECDEHLMAQGYEYHYEADEGSGCEGYLYQPEGPMMNYMYPIDTRRVGGEDEAALAIAELPLCVVCFIDGPYDGETFLALTGGGMDLSWEICEAYMRLGYLPPLHFSRLPQFAGKSLNDTTRWIIGGMRESARISQGWLDQINSHLDVLEERMAEVKG